MRKNRTISRIEASTVAIVLLLLSFAGCKKEAFVSTTSGQVNITGYLDKNPDKFSEFRKILEITETAGFLQAYGNYTIFLPTNDGVKAYLKDIGKASVEQVDVQELKNIVRFHLLEDTITTTKFGDGKLERLTMLGQYIITGATNTGGVTKITINRQANLQEANIRLGNGYVHVIDNVLRPAKQTLAQMIEANPSYSVFTRALKETGLYDTLNILPADNTNPDTTQRFLTILAESDQVLASAGIGSYEALKTKYNTGVADLKNHANGLHAYMAYHILLNAKYLADIAIAQAHATLARPEIITAKLQNEQIILNDMEFNGAYEPGIILNRSASDNSASNGVMHTTAPYTYNYTFKNSAGQTVTEQGTTTGQFAIKTRVPFPVYWDVADFPESRRHPNFRTSGNIDFIRTTATTPTPIAGWFWPKTGTSTGYGVTYRNDKNNWVNGDYLNMVLGVSSRQDYIDMRTPLIVRGRYNVWICYRRQNQSGNWPARIGTQVRVNVDGGEPAPKTFYFAEPIPFGSTAELESLGWKYYTSNGNEASPFVKQTYNAANGSWGSPWIAKNIGVITIATTDVHTIRLEAIADSQNANNLDMIQFIPVGWQSQILPRFKPDGSMDYTNYPGTHP